MTRGQSLACVLACAVEFTGAWVIVHWNVRGAFEIVMGAILGLVPAIYIAVVMPTKRKSR